MDSQEDILDMVGGEAARVLESGLAFLDAGEMVLPKAGNEAQAEQVIADSQSVIHYHFPVVIEVCNVVEPVDHDKLAEHTLLCLTRSLKSLQG